MPREDALTIFIGSLPVSNKFAKSGVISALAVLVSQAGVTPSAVAQNSASVEERCADYAQIYSRTELQNQLEALIADDPDDACIPYLLTRLRGPLAAGFQDDPDRPGDGVPTGPTPGPGPGPGDPGGPGVTSY